MSVDIAGRIERALAPAPGHSWMDRVVYETTADDGCPMTTVIKLGREWVDRDSQAALTEVAKRIALWRERAMYWHLREGHPA